VLQHSAVASLIDLAFEIRSEPAHICHLSNSSFSNAQGSISFDALDCMRASARC